MSKAAPVVGMILAFCIVLFLVGTMTAHYKVFPYPNIRDAVRTLRVLVKEPPVEQRVPVDGYMEKTTILASNAAKARWTILDPSVPRLPVIANGGMHRFRDLCPDQGCLAVAYDGQGNVAESWPFRPVNIFAADITDGAYPHEMLGFDPGKHVRLVSVQPYANSDILVIMHSSGGAIFPFGMGVTRVAPDGTPRWTRADYSHHWSTFGADGLAYVPSLKVGKSNVSFHLGTGASRLNHTLGCRSERPQLDIIQKIDGTGAVVEEIELMPIFLKSNWAGLLPESTEYCDPLHLNYIDHIGADAGPGLDAGDLVLSLRNISRFVIFDSKTRRIKRVVGGSFAQQHSVHHLSGSKFLIFDNRGGDALGPASRIIELDLADGAERRIFPNAETPDAYAQVYSDRAGYLDISPDRRRMLASFTQAGLAFEVDIASGRLLAVFDNVHDISSVADIPEDAKRHAGRFEFFGMSYMK
jgi:hypothetical protein